MTNDEFGGRHGEFWGRDRAEAEILLRCTRAALHEGRVKESCNLGDGAIEWARLLHMANRHGLAEILHRYLNACVNQDSIPPDIRTGLATGYRSSAIRALLMSRELCRIHERFQEARIPLVPFKGPTLGQYAYGDSCLRPSGDLDFLIKKDDIHRAKRLLLAAGYKPEFMLSPKQEAALLQVSCEYCFYHGRNRLLVELHWNIVPNYASFGLSADEIWEHLIPFEFFGRQMMIPSPEYMLLILIVHNGGKHQWERLGWILDVAQLIRSCKKLDWERVTGIAARKGMLRSLGLGLYMAQDLFSVELPGEVSRRITRDSRIRELADRIYARLFAHPEPPPLKLDHLMFSLKVRERVADKIRYCGAQLVMSDLEDRQCWNLPGPLMPLYGLRRLARWLRA